MGLWKILTTPIGNKLSWREPFFLGTRLRNRLMHKLAAMAVCLVVGVVGMLIVAGKPTGPRESYAPAVLVGLLGAGMLILVFGIRADDHSGTVKFRGEEIQRKRNLSGLEMLGGWAIFQTETWPYSSIRECRIIPGGTSGHRFSVLEIYTGREIDWIGVPQRVDLDRLIRRLEIENVPVSRGLAISPESASIPVGIHMPDLIAFLVITALMIVAGCYMFANKQDNPQADARDDLLARAGMPELDREDWLPDGFSGGAPPPPPPPPPQRQETVPPPPPPRRQETAIPTPPEPQDEEASGTGPPIAGRPSDFPGPPLPRPPAPTMPAPVRPPGGFGPRMAPPGRTPGDAPSPSRNRPREDRPVRSDPDVDPPGKPDFRTWSTPTGKFQVEAVLVDFQDGKVTLRRRDGRTVVVPLWRLSQADRAYVAETKQGDRLTRPPSGAKQDTELVGGDEGWPFRHEDQKLLLGIRYGLGGWAGEKTVGRIEPVFDRKAAGDGESAVVARVGYAVGALKVDAQRFVNAMQIVFMRRTPAGRLDPSDSYTSDWIGFPTGRPPKTVGAADAIVVGVYGRHGAILNAVGLVVKGR